MYVIVLKKKLKSGGQQSNCFGMNNGLISAIRNTFSSMSTMSVLIMPFFFVHVPSVPQSSYSDLDSGFGSNTGEIVEKGMHTISRGCFHPIYKEKNTQ
jgi:hypothetical protein